MIKSIQASNQTPHILRLTVALTTLFSKPVQFSKLTIIIGDNGTGKSQLIGLLCALIDSDMNYDDKVYDSGIKYSPFSFYRERINDSGLTINRESNSIIVYHQGLNKNPMNLTERCFGSNGENVLYELLTLTSDIQKYDRSLQNSARWGEDIIKFKSHITKKFLGNELELNMISPAALICDEPELGLSPTRVKKLVDYFESWVSFGNQLIMTTNHPWLMSNWSAKLNPLIIDLDNFQEKKFSFQMR